LPEFRRTTLQALASVLREKSAGFSRSRSFVRIPADPLAVVATATGCAHGASKETKARYEERLQDLAALFGMKRIDVPALNVSEIVKHGHP
jgi:hypothetical protein